MKSLALIANAGCVALILALAIPFVLRGGKYIPGNEMSLILSVICSVLTVLPHELLHALCFRGDVCFYTDFRHGLAFVVGTEDMSRPRFIWMCLCPNVVLGILPYVVFLACPRMVFAGLFGLLCVGMGFGDYINVFNAITQMPKGARTYLSGMHSYWYPGE